MFVAFTALRLRSRLRDVEVPRDRGNWTSVNTTYIGAFVGVGQDQVRRPSSERCRSCRARTMDAVPVRVLWLKALLRSNDLRSSFIGRNAARVDIERLNGSRLSDHDPRFGRWL